MKNKSEIVIYQTQDNKTQVEVKIEHETVWLTQQQIAHLFDQTKQNISLHINNCFKEGELDRDSTVKESLTVQAEGNRSVKRKIEFYNLDVIISVGYRVKSIRGTQFRIWANRILKEYLIKGYALNEKRLQEQKRNLIDLNASIKLLEKTVLNRAEKIEEARDMVKIISEFSRGLALLDDYDHERLDNKGITKNKAVFIGHDEFISVLVNLKTKFDSPLFGKEKDESFKSSISQIYQSFGESDLYPSIEEKAAMLLYFVVKNHSFIDGNKRIAAALFLYFLDKNNILYNNIGMPYIEPQTLASLTLMIAESRPEEKDMALKIVISVLNRSKETT